MRLLWMAFKLVQHYISVQKLSDLLLSTLILLFPPPVSSLRVDDALPSYCKSYLWLDKQITVRFHCGVRLEVHGSMKFFITGNDNTGGHWRKAGYLRYLSGYREGFFFCLAASVQGRLQAARPSLCFWRDSRSRTLTLWHSLTTDREEECVLLSERVGEGRERGWGCSKSHLPLCALSKQFTLLCVSAARASFAQPFLLISPICRQLETCCSLAASR